MTPLAPGQYLAGKYEIRRQIGRGGFGAVYAAIQHPVNRPVAIKIIVPEKAHDRQMEERFSREARAIGLLRHASTVTLHDYGIDGGRLYMVMEFIEGTELSHIIQREAPLAPGRVAALAMQAAGALAEAHASKLIHRDIKPSNMMVTAGPLGEEQLKLLDFGIVKLIGSEDDAHATRTGIAIGTPAYMSPEQSIGRGVAEPTDQYSLGVVMFHMLTGRKPFVAPSSLEVLNLHRTAPIPPIPPERGVPATLEAIVRRAMSKDPRDRFPDMASMARALRAVAVEVPDDTVAAPPTQDRSTVLGIGSTLEPLWSGATSLEMQGAVGPPVAPRRTSRTHSVFAGLLVTAAGVGVTVALLAADRDVTPPLDPGPDVPTRIALGTAALDAVVPDAAVDAAPPDMAPDVAVDAAPEAKKPKPPPKEKSGRRSESSPREPSARPIVARPSPVRSDLEDRPPVVQPPVPKPARTRSFVELSDP